MKKKGCIHVCPRNKNARGGYTPSNRCTKVHRRRNWATPSGSGPLGPPPDTTRCGHYFVAIPGLTPQTPATAEVRSTPGEPLALSRPRGSFARPSHLTRVRPPPLRRQLVCTRTEYLLSWAPPRRPRPHRMNDQTGPGYSTEYLVNHCNYCLRKCSSAWMKTDADLRPGGPPSMAIVNTAIVSDTRAHTHSHSLSLSLTGDQYLTPCCGDHNTSPFAASCLHDGDARIRAARA